MLAYAVMLAHAVFSSGSDLNMFDRLWSGIALCGNAKVVLQVLAGLHSCAG